MVAISPVASPTSDHVVPLSILFSSFGLLITGAFASYEIFLICFVPVIVISESPAYAFTSNAFNSSETSKSVGIEIFAVTVYTRVVLGSEHTTSSALNSFVPSESLTFVIFLFESNVTLICFFAAKCESVLSSVKPSQLSSSTNVTPVTFVPSVACWILIGHL